MRDKDEGTEGVREVALRRAQDLPDRAVDDSAIGPARRVDIAGRCANCWGQCLEVVDGNDRRLELACGVCEQRVGEEDVELETKRMESELARNLHGARVGLAAEYDESARFVLKILPNMDMDKAKFRQRVEEAKQRASSRSTRRGKITRHDFGERGTPGFLFMQASALVSGLGLLPRDIAVVSHSDFDFENLSGELQDSTVDADGQLSISASIPRKTLHEETVMKRFGAAMIRGFVAAFACEVGMKSLLLTRVDEADKSHDLLALFESLPEDCQSRLQGDYSAIAEIMTRYRHTFDRWRYFEPNVGQDALSILVNLDQIFGLEKAARVILDECIVAGLQYHWDVQYGMDFPVSVYIDPDLTVRAVPDEGSFSTKVTMQVSGHESEIPWDDILSLSAVRRNMPEEEN